MKNLIIVAILFITLICPAKANSQEYLYILNDKCLSALFDAAKKHFPKDTIGIYKEAQGIILSFDLERSHIQNQYIDSKSYQKILQVGDFLAKIKNPAIIEVHTEQTSLSKKYKNWELATILANKLERIVLRGREFLVSRVNSIGYGEFLPSKNTPYNGSISGNRVDIIILCSISGE